MSTDYRTITFKECGTHKEVLFACERCPVCVAIEDRDLALGRAEYDKTQLEGRIADLEQKQGAWGFKDGEEYPK